MKKNLFGFLGLGLIFFSSSCGDTPKSNELYVPQIDVHKDLEEYKGEDNNETFYTSKYVSFTREVKGYFQTNIPFTVSEDENIRIYDDLYFYEDDMFYLISSDYKYIWATLSDENVTYASVLREQGEDIEVQIKKDGIYKVTLDMTTMIMDLTYKSEITTPYYYPFENVSIGVLKDGTIEYTDLITNPSNEDEFYISDYEVESGKLYSFYSSFSHTSVFKLTFSDSAKDYMDYTMYSDCYLFKIAAKFNIYVNKKTYEIRVEVDPLAATYYCVIYNGGFVTLSPKDPSVPYVFEYEYEATSDVGGYGVVSDDLPKFYSKNYKEYNLTVLESNLLGENNGDYYFKKKGLYKITVDLYNLTLQVEKVES